MSDEQISRMMDRYKKGLETKKKLYHDVKKHDPEFVAKNRERARLHYHNNKHIKKEKYENNKDFLKAKSLLQYYKYNNKVNIFKDKHPEKVELLFTKGITC